MFVGYGYVNEDEKYDDFKGLDVSGKVIVRLSGYPGHNDTSSDAYKKFHPEGRYAEYYLGREKNDVAGQKGVAGIIDIYPGGDRSSRWTTNTPFRYSRKYYEGDKQCADMMDNIVQALHSSALTITGYTDVMKAMLEYSSITVDETEPTNPVRHGVLRFSHWIG